LPQLRKYQERTHKWDRDNMPEFGPLPGRRVIIWYHDETIFYAHDRRKVFWQHNDASAKPYAKGEGASLMIADFVSADFGYLVAPDGRSARVILKPGKNRDGYFKNDEVLAQSNDAMDLVFELYPDFEHIFVYDNATIHAKRPEGSISARYMTKKMSANFGVEVTKRDANGNPCHKMGADGVEVLQKIKIPMRDPNFELPDGSKQTFYYPNGEHKGKFKGIVKILEERGEGNLSHLLLQCEGFKCADTSLAARCCCRRILFNQPDFVNVPSALEVACAARGVTVLFLPKFHCELNFIEQVWGYAKRLYRVMPESSREDVLLRNALEALDSVPLACMRRFANRADRFSDSYRIGLTGATLMWATRKYHGHRVLPDTLMDDMEEWRNKTKL
jgi:hypothetical protein